MGTEEKREREKYGKLGRYSGRRSTDHRNRVGGRGLREPDSKPHRERRRKEIPKGERVERREETRDRHRRERPRAQDRERTFCSPSPGQGVSEKLSSTEVAGTAIRCPRAPGASRLLKPEAGWESCTGRRSWGRGLEGGGAHFGFSSPLLLEAGTGGI